MNKISSTLAGLALVAAVGAAPAFAQGTFTVNPVGTSFTFTDSAAGITALNIPVLFNPMAAGGTTSTGTLTLSGGTLLFGTPPTGTFTGVTETFTPGTGTLTGFSDTGTVFVSQRSATTFDLASDTTTFTGAGGSAPGFATNFDLVPGTPAVPEASTTVSLGALLALGGLAIVLRRKSAKNAA